MANESGGPDLRDVWQAQPEMEPRMTTDEIRGKVWSIEQEGRRRSLVMVASGLYGSVIRGLRGITAKTVDKEPKWRHRGKDLTTGYEKIW